MIYFICFCIILILLAIMITYGRNMDINAVLAVISIAVGNGGCYALSVSENLHEAVLANKLIYVMGAFAPMLAFLIICNACKINVPGWVSAVLYVLQTFIYITVLNIGDMDIFYTSVEYHTGPFGAYLAKTYGFMHTLFVVMVILYTLATLIVALISLNRSNTVSRLNVYILLIAYVFVAGTYIVERLVDMKMEMLSVSFTVAVSVMMAPLFRIYRYSTANIWGLYARELQNTGYIFFDNNLRFMGYNDVAARFYPELTGWEIDRRIPGNGGRFNTFLRQPLMEYIKSELTQQSADSMYEYDGRTYRYKIGPLDSQTDKKIGYVIWIYDETKTGL